MFGFGKLKCECCGIELKSEIQQWAWKNKKFCSEHCKRTYRHGKSKSGGSCH